MRDPEKRRLNVDSPAMREEVHDVALYFRVKGHSEEEVHEIITKLCQEIKKKLGDRFVEDEEREEKFIVEVDK